MNIWGRAVLGLLLAEAYVLELELDGQAAPLRFAAHDDLPHVARAWRAAHPTLSGVDCPVGDGVCVENVLVRAMEQQFDAKAVIAAAAAHCLLEGHAFPEDQFQAALGTTDESYALEQVAGLCYCAADRAFVNDTKGGNKAATLAMDAAGLSLRLEPRRARAARFGQLSGQDLFGVADATARFAKVYAQLKWPPDGSLPDLVLGGNIDLPLTLEPRVAWSPSIDESRAFVQMGWVHSAFPKFVGDQLRYLVGKKSTACVERFDVEANMEGLDALRRGATARRKAHAIDEDEALAYAYVQVEEGGRLDLPLTSLNATVPPILGAAACITEAPAVLDGALKVGPDAVQQATRAFEANGIAVVDEMLKDETLERLRAFVLGSTIFTRAYAQGYLGAFLGDGFGSAGVVQQVASELREQFPDLLGDTALRQAWAYVYPRDGHPRGIDVHSDDADVSVNIWITPDPANLDPTTGGLRIWNREPPADWAFGKANRDLDAIGAILEEASYVSIPYHFNRAILLNGHRFHQTDSLRFKGGLEHHRINLTFLFAKRSAATACRV